MTVVGKTKTTDADTGINSYANSTIYTDKPCHISYDSTDVDSMNNVSNETQKIILMCSPDLTIPAGSKIIVTQNGVTIDYEMSGVPAMYRTHQEINVEIFRGRA
jgi:hypothetical protein